MKEVIPAGVYRLSPKHSNKTFNHRPKWSEKQTPNIWVSHLHEVTDIILLSALVRTFEFSTQSHKHTYTHRCNPVRCSDKLHYLFHSSERVFTLLSQVTKINYHTSQSQWPRGLRRGSAAASLLGLRIWIPLGHGYLYLVRVVLLVSATVWSFVQRSLIQRGVSECERDALTMRRSWQTRGCRTRKIYSHKSRWSCGLFLFF
jgi:hypothetical protein